MSLFFTSDPHFGHANIIRYCNRPFSDVDEMNKTLIHRWNAVVKETDVVYILGDMFLCGAGEAKGILHALNGTKRLLLGNHDAVIRRSPELQQMFDEVRPGHPQASGEYSIWTDTIEGIPISMCHFPLLTWHGSGRGAYHLHGHCHGTIPFDGVSRRLDVGVDAHDYAPIAWEDIRRKLEAIPLRRDSVRSKSMAP